MFSAQTCIKQKLAPNVAVLMMCKKTASKVA